MMNKDIITLEGKNTKTVDDMGKIAQLQALKQDAIDIKMADLVKRLRADINSLNKKANAKGSEINELEDALRAAANAEAEKMIAPERRKLIRVLKAMFGNSISDSIVGTAYGRINGETFEAHASTDIELNHGCERLHFERELTPENRDDEALLKLSRDLEQLNKEHIDLRTLRDDCEERLNDTDYIEKQVRAEMSKLIFKGLGIDSDVLESINNLDVFAIEEK